MEIMKTGAMPKTKEELDIAIEFVVDNILEGHKNPLLIARELKAMEDLVKAVRKNDKVRELTFEEAEKHGGKTFDAHGCQFQVKESGVKYDYSHCDDDILNDLHKQLEDIQKKVKEREIFLKNLPEDSPIFNEEGVQIMRPIKKSTTSLTVKMK